MNSQQRFKTKAQQIVLSSGLRGAVMFTTGLGLTIREALTKGPDRPSLYVLFAGMMGLPLVWGKAEKSTDKDDKDDSKDSD